MSSEHVSTLVTSVVAASFLKVTPETLAVWRCTKRYPLKFVRVGRKILYRISDIEAFIEREANGGRLINPPLSDLLAIEE